MIAGPFHQASSITDKALAQRAVILRLEAGALKIGLLDRDVARILQLPDGGWPLGAAVQWSPMDDRQKRRLCELDRFCRMAATVFGNDAPRWLRDINDEVGVSPLEFLEDGPGALDAMCRALRDVIDHKGRKVG
jgi:hypothetical protein